MNPLETIRNYLTENETDFIKFFEKGNMSAGTRVRKHMQELKKIANAVREEVQTKKKQKKD